MSIEFPYSNTGLTYISLLPRQDLSLLLIIVARGFAAEAPIYIFYYVVVKPSIDVSVYSSHGFHKNESLFCSFTYFVYLCGSSHLDVQGHAQVDW
jgi:hypothetical protein